MPRNIFNRRPTRFRLLYREAGFTLIEVLAVTLMVGLVFTGGIAAMVPLLRFLGIEQSKTTASDEMVIALEWIRRDAMQASQAVINGTNTTVTLTITDYIAGTDDTVLYQQNGNDLERVYTPDGGSAQTKIITRMLDSLQFTNGTVNNPDDVENCLIAEVHIKDTATNEVAEQRYGIMLSCQSTPEV